MVYVANGSGSGVWTLASTIIANSAWSTADVKLTYKQTPDTGWVMMNDGTIGDGSSGGTTRANADTQALFFIMWPFALAGVGNMTVSGGIGATAAADFAAHKTITLPRVLGRALVISGAGSGLTSRNLAGFTGEETHALVASEIPTILSSGSGTISGVIGSTGSVVTGNGTSNVAAGGNAIGIVTAAQSSTFTGTASVTTSSTNTGGAGHNVMQPSAFLNVMIKL